MKSNKAVWQMSIAMLLSGTIGWIVLLSGQTPETVVFFRCVIGAVSLLALVSWQSKWQAMNGASLRWVVGGAIALILNWLFLFSAYRYSGVGLTTVIYHVQPFFLIIMSAIAQRELPSKVKIVGLLIAFLGVIMTGDLHFDADNAAMTLGALLALAAAFLYAIATLATRQLKQFDSAQIAGIQLFIGAVSLLPLLHFDIATFSSQTWSALITLGLVHTAFMYKLMYAAFQKLPAASLASLSYIYPVVALLVDVLFLNTQLNGRQWYGMLLIILAVFTNQQSERLTSWWRSIFMQAKQEKI